MGGAFIAGALAILSPGLALLLPGYAAFCARCALNDRPSSPQDRKTSTAFLVTVAGFIAGFLLAFVALSASATALSQYFIARLDFFSNLAGVVVVVFGLLIAASVRTGGAVGALLLGLSFAIGWTPSISPGLAAILVTAARPDAIGQALVQLTSYALGLSVPLLLVALVVRLGSARMRDRTRAIEIVCGALIMGVGVLIFTNR